MKTHGVKQKMWRKKNNDSSLVTSIGESKSETKNDPELSIGWICTRSACSNDVKSHIHTKTHKYTPEESASETMSHRKNRCKREKIDYTTFHH